MRKTHITPEIIDKIRKQASKGKTWPEMYEATENWRLRKSYANPTTLQRAVETFCESNNLPPILFTQPTHPKTTIPFDDKAKALAFEHKQQHPDMTWEQIRLHFRIFAEPYRFIDVMSTYSTALKSSKTPSATTNQLPSQTPQPSQRTSHTK